MIHVSQHQGLPTTTHQGLPTTSLTIQVEMFYYESARDITVLGYLIVLYYAENKKTCLKRNIHSKGDKVKLGTANQANKRTDPDFTVIK